MSDVDSAAAPPRGQRRPSPIFIGLLAVCIIGGFLAWTGVGNERVGLFVFVVAGWLVSLCLHEFAHALVALHSGDRGVIDKGYLTLDPRRYSDLSLSIILPVVFVLLGGIGLPGGAVWIDRGRIPGRLRHSLVAAAGPLTNVAFALLLVGGFHLYDHFPGAHPQFWAGVAYLAFLQVTASLLNLLPVPGLDGFGIVEPWLPRSWVRQAAQVGPYGLLLVFGLLWLRPVNRVFFDTIFRLMDALGVPAFVVQAGDQLFRFWT